MKPSHAFWLGMILLSIFVLIINNISNIIDAYNHIVNYYTHTEISIIIEHLVVYHFFGIILFVIIVIVCQIDEFDDSPILISILLGISVPIVVIVITVMGYSYKGIKLFNRWLDSLETKKSTNV